MTDDEIIALYWDRQESAISACSKQYGGYCYSIAYRILNCREDADECVNDTWLQAWHAIPPKRPAILSAFLAKITRNLSFDQYKKRNAKKRGGGELPLVLEELEECVASSSSTEEPVLGAALSQSINRFLRGLPEQECSIFLCRYWYGKSLKEIAGQFSIKETAAKTRLFRTRAKLKIFLEKEGIIL